MNTDKCTAWKKQSLKNSTFGTWEEVAQSACEVDLTAQLQFTRRNRATSCCQPFRSASRAKVYGKVSAPAANLEDGLQRLAELTGLLAQFQQKLVNDGIIFVRARMNLNGGLTKHDERPGNTSNAIR